MLRKKIVSGLVNTVGKSAAPVSPGSFIQFGAFHTLKSVSNGVVAAAMSGASVVAIVAALLAAQTSPSEAGNCLSNVTGLCTGPILPVSGSFSNSGSIGGAPTGVSIASGITITPFANSGTISALGQAGIGIGIDNHYGTISALSNSGTISVTGVTAYGIYNAHSMANLTNSGKISVTGSSWTHEGVFNSGSVNTLTNSGIISVLAHSGTAFGIVNLGTIDILTNSGSISASEVGSVGHIVGIVNIGQINELNNSGSIHAAASYSASGIANGGSIGTLTNRGTITASALLGNAAGITNGPTGTIANLTNSGSIGASALSAYGIYNDSGSIKTLTNSGSLNASGSGYAAGVYNSGTIDFLNNGGTINSASEGGSADGIFNSGTITNITDMGVIHGGSVDIRNDAVIGMLTIAQGGGGTLGSGSLSALTFTGNLPGTYLEYISSSTHYGQIVGTNVSGTMAFDIAPGSHLNAGTYKDVVVMNGGTIAGVSGGTLSGTFGSQSVIWILSDPPAPTIHYDLIVPVNETTTKLQLAASSAEVLSAMRLGAAVATNALTYDCGMFDKSNVCISFNARYSSMDVMNEGAGVMTAAYRLDGATRIGAIIDYAGKPRSSDGIEYKDPLPMFGGFIAYSEKPDGKGLQTKLIGAYYTGRATFTRNENLYDATEAGNGTASISALAIGGQIGYGFQTSKYLVATPYAGLQYGDATRASYQEVASDTVTAPVSYDAYYQHVLTGTFGLRLNGQMDENITYQVTGGFEYDLSSDINAYSGSFTTIGSDPSSFSIPNTANANRLRGTGSVAVGYALAPNQKLTTSISVRGEAYSDKADTNVMAGYEIGF